MIVLLTRLKLIYKNKAYKGNPAMRKEITAMLKKTKWNVLITTYDYILKDRLTLHKWDWKVNIFLITILIDKN
jgi:hypothetical protein